jgi:hypothetical protein
MRLDGYLADVYGITKVSNRIRPQSGSSHASTFSGRSS